MSESLLSLLKKRKDPVKMEKVGIRAPKKGEVQVETTIVDRTAKNGIYVKVGNKNLSIFIKQNQLAKEIENSRPSRFNRGDKVDAKIIELNKAKKTVVLSIKALELQEEEENIKKFGAKDSGGRIADILGPLIKKKNKK